MAGEQRYSSTEKWWINSRISELREKIKCFYRCENMSAQREKKMKRRTRELQHRWRFDSIISSLSPPTFMCCETSSRLFSGFPCRVWRESLQQGRFFFEFFIIFMLHCHIKLKFTSEHNPNTFFTPSSCLCAELVFTCVTAAPFLSHIEHHVTCLPKIGGLE